MSPATKAPDRERRVHLGILRDELRGKSYERFFRWEMDPLPEHIEQVLEERPSNPADALPRTEVNRLLAPSYLPFENGFARLDDGTVHVAVLTQFPGATAEMIDWWFAWHGDETERYKLWHPQAHLYTEWREQRHGQDLTYRQKYVGNTSFVDEYVGPSIQRLAIQFREPREFGFDESSFEEARIGTAVCARTGFSDRPVDAGYLIHLIRETNEGCEMRSRFWIGEVHLRALPDENVIDGLLNRRALRNRILPSRVARDLFIHCAEEMNHLASFLPQLFAQER